MANSASPHLTLTLSAPKGQRGNADRHDIHNEP